MSWIDTCERLGWTVTDEGDGFYISQYSPAGEDFGFSIGKKNPKDEIMDYYQDFDVDEHVTMWINAKASGMSGVPTIKELVHDAEKIESMLEELAVEVA